MPLGQQDLCCSPSAGSQLRAALPALLLCCKAGPTPLLKDSHSQIHVTGSSGLEVCMWNSRVHPLFTPWALAFYCFQTELMLQICEVISKRFMSFVPERLPSPLYWWSEQGRIILTVQWKERFLRTFNESSHSSLLYLILKAKKNFRKPIIWSLHFFLLEKWIT